ncbi:MAG: anti-sigma regulatory factor [Gammaproteobacteria bacterium]|jgi:serine/threonine-protein kinase RsbT
MSAELRRTIQSEMDARHAVLESTLYSQQAGFDDTPSRMIGTVVSELARNILKYAGHGEVRLRRINEPGRRGIEIEVVDTGPGIADCKVAMEDHYSSGGTLGLGLPGVKRMMDDFSLESTPGKGTRITARKWI